MKYWKTVLGVAAAGVALSALTLNAANSADEAKEVVVGYTGALTGSAASWGAGMAAGIKEAFADLDVVTIAGRPYRFTLDALDDAYNTQTAVANAQRLILEKGIKLGATMGGAIGVVTEPVMSSAGVLQFHLGAAEAYLGKDKPLSLRAHMSSLDAFYVYWPWIAEHYPDIKTVALFQPDDDTGRQSKFHEEAAIAKTRLKPVAYELVPRSTTDFYPILTKVLATHPDALSFYNPPGQQPIAAKQARELGFKGPIFLPSMETKSVVAALGDKANGIINPVALTIPLTEKAKKVQQAWSDANGGKAAPALLLDGYNIGQMMIRAAEDAGTVDDAKAVNASLHRMDLSDTVFGKMCWHEVKEIDNAMYGPVAITIIKNGTEELVDIAQPPCK
jgi:branched-chain amino acid transport system substrate-binding protein